MLIFMFPGQSSRYPGMLEKIEKLHPQNAAIVDRACSVLDWDLRAQFAEENEAAYARSLDVQIGVFLANHLFMRTLQARGVDAEISLGLSLGEYNHLVHIGALGFEEALRTVRARGEAYEAGPRGWMASVQPIDLEELEGVVQDVGARHGLLEIVNLNSPRQHVISGVQAAVEAAVGQLEADHYVQPEIIERQVPMHSTLFEVVGERFRAQLEGVNFQTPDRPYLPNRLGRFLEEPTRADFIDLCATHVHEPVYWRRSIECVRHLHPEAVFVEVGPRAVLHNLMQRKWLRNPKFRTDSRDDTAAHLDEVVGALDQWRHPLEVGCSAS
jgi:[acyl-carrier-protein] S-malonyltransferase